MNKVALVTGGETGIGAAISTKLRARDFEVVSASRRNGVDLLDAGAIQDLVAGLTRLDVLVNNAGIAESAPVHKMTDELWDRHLALNVTAPMRLVRAALPLLKASKGCVINMGSTAGLRGSPYIAAYAASKHALLGLTRVLAAELKDVRVHAVCPGFVDTPLTDRSIARVVDVTERPVDDIRASIASQNPSGRLITPDEVAAAVLALIDSDTTGQEPVLE